MPPCPRKWPMLGWLALPALTSQCVATQTVSFLGQKGKMFCYLFGRSLETYLDSLRPGMCHLILMRWSNISFPSQNIVCKSVLSQLRTEASMRLMGPMFRLVWSWRKPDTLIPLKWDFTSHLTTLNYIFKWKINVYLIWQLLDDNWL